MKKPIFLILTFLMALSLACGFNFSTASLQNARLAQDEAGSQSTTVFGQDDIFYLVADLENAPDDTKVKAIWTAVEADGVDPNFSLGEKELSTGSGQVNFNLSNDQLWPAGDYKVDLYLNDELKQTLTFTVEGDAVAEEPSPTPEPTEEPTATSEPTEEPTAIPEPTATPVASSGDTLDPDTGETEEENGEATEEVGEASGEEEPAEEPTVEPLPLQEEPYVHPSGAFSFSVPEGWEVASEDATSVTFGGDDSAVGAVFVDMGAELTNSEKEEFIDSFVENFVSAFGDDYQIIEQRVNDDGSTFVALGYTSEEGNGDIDLLFDQQETVMFVLYFASTKYTELQSTWELISGSYAVDAEAALAAAPAEAPTVEAPPATPTPAPLPPTPTPAPAVDPLAPAAGRSRLWVFNEFGQEIIFTINNQQHTIPTGGFDNMTPIDLDPGRYTYTFSLPGSGAANGEVTMAANEAWAVGVRGDSAVYNPVKVSPQ